MKLMLIDGNSVLNRAFYGIKALSAPDGTPTNAIYGFLSMFKRFVAELKPDASAVTFDLKAPTFRHIYYPEYKAQRKPMCDELAVQIPILKQILKLMNVPILQIEGYEADDILGTISMRNEKEGYNTVVVTGDRDSLQLVSDKTQVYLLKGNISKNENILYTPEVFFYEYGFEPCGIVDLKALMGDASDNIPGIKGIGEKTAMGLIQQYKTVDKLYSLCGTEDLPDKIKNKLISDKDNAELSYYLATINRNIPISLNTDEAVLNDVYSPELYDLFIKLGFNKFIEEWNLSANNESDDEITDDFSYIDADDSDFNAIIEMIDREPLLYVISHEPDKEIFIKGHDSYHICRISCFMTYDGILEKIFDGKTELVGHDVKFLIRKLLPLGYTGSGFIFDIAVAAYLLDANSGRYDLSYLSTKYLGRNIVNINAMAALYNELRTLLKEKDLLDLFYSIEMPLCEILAEMEHTGFNVSKKSISEFGEYLNSELEKLKNAIYSYSCYEFNINSTKQLGVFLFDELKLPYGKKTKTGWSTNSEVLDKLSTKHPVIEMIKKYRMYTKLKSTYADGLLKQIDSDGRIRTAFQMTATSTGRLSSSEPNLQNIPVRTEIGAKLREMFLPTTGWQLIDADYSQIELRILASISQDEGMISAFNNNADFHAATAAELFGVDISQVTPGMRSSVKAVNFGIIYGMSAFSLSQDLHISVDEAKSYIESYYSKFPKVKSYLDNTVKKAIESGFVKTAFGRIREIPELSSSNFNLRSFGERVAYNMPIQGTAADIIKIAMINVYKRLKTEKMQTRMLLQVHDELILEAPMEELDYAKTVLWEEMEKAAKLPVKLLVDVKSGANWAEAH